MIVQKAIHALRPTVIEGNVYCLQIQTPGTHIVVTHPLNGSITRASDVLESQSRGSAEVGICRPTLEIVIKWEHTLCHVILAVAIACG